MHSAKKILQDIPRPLVIFIRGLPGSGKTYLSHELVESLGKEDVIILDPDEVDQSSDTYKANAEALRVEGVDDTFHLYRYLRNQFYLGVQNSAVILWNQPFTNLEMFRKMTTGFMDYAREAGKDLTVLVIEVHTDSVVAYERVTKRKAQGGHGPSESTFRRFVGDFKSFEDEGFNVVKVDGLDTVGALTAITAALTALG